MRKHSFRNVIIAVLVLVLSMSVLSACGGSKKKDREEAIVLWYTESAMKDYLEAAAKAYEKKYEITVTCKQKESGHYLEDIYQKTIDGEKDAPDVYLLGHEKLERACMQGVAAKNSSKVYKEKNYCATALESAKYKKQLMAYPLYYNTTCMLYNTQYFETAPATMGAITAFSETAEISENIQYILYWDINDYICNYPLVGNYLNIGGKTGDDSDSLSIVNEQMIACLQGFQGLGQYFAIDSETIQTADIPAALMEGRTLCILSDCDMVHVVNWYEQNHGTKIPYRICAVPDVSDELKSCSGSYTELAVVNGLSGKQEKAAEFAKFLTYDYVNQLYDKTGHFAAKRGVKYRNEELSELYKIYEQSKQFPKLLETEDLSVSLEVLFANVWKGSDIVTELNSFAKKMELRIN